MGNYNAIAGISEENLNRLTVQLYENLYKSSKLFKDTRIFDKPLLYSVSYDITTTPVFTLAPSAGAMEKLMEAVNGLTDNPESLPEFRKFIEEGIVTFSVDVPSVSLSVVLVKGKAPIIDLKASITAGCSVEINNEGKVIPRIISASIKLPGFEPIEKVLNAIALPVIIELMNNFVSKGFTLPLLKLAGAEFSHPVARIENKTLVTYVSLLKYGPTILPEKQPVQPNQTFAFFDRSIAESAAATALVNTQKSGTDGIDILGLKLGASYIGGIKDPIFEFKEGVETGITFTAYGGGKLSIQYLGLPAVTASFTASATPTASSSLILTQGQLFYTLQHINDFKVYIDIDLSVLPLPKFIKDIINANLSFLFKPFAQLFGEILHGLTIPICNIKPIEFEVSGVKMAICLASETITTIVGPESKKLVCVEAMLGVALYDNI